jgi:hypothetical protein
VSKFSKTRAPKQKGPMPAFPEFQFITAIQMQFFDNGEKPGRGKNQYTMITEVYAGGHFNIMKPYWKRTVALLDPDQVIKWADEKLAWDDLTPMHHQQYANAYAMAEEFMTGANALWAKIGYFEDRRAHLRYPGQCMLVVREDKGPMHAFLFDGTEECKLSNPFQFDHYWRPGTNRRLFYGWYDPNEIYAKTKEWKEREEKAVEALRQAREAEGAADVKTPPMNSEQALASFLAGQSQ